MPNLRNLDMTSTGQSDISYGSDLYVSFLRSYTSAFDFTIKMILSQKDDFATDFSKYFLDKVGVYFAPRGLPNVAQFVSRCFCDGWLRRSIGNVNTM